VTESGSDFGGSAVSGGITPEGPEPSADFDGTPLTQEDFPVASATDESLDFDDDPTAENVAEVDVTGEGVTDEVVEPRSLADLLEREGEVAADYLEGLLDIIDADGDIDMDVEGDRAVVSIIGDRLRHLVGPDGAVLDALQELTRLAVARETGVRSRLMLDVGGHRARRRTDLTALGTKAAEEVIATGEAVKMAPMSAFERKVVHDAIAAAGLRSESEGVEPQRFVVVLPAQA
jgi:spoIIIJ-associated protein